MGTRSDGSQDLSWLALDGQFPIACQTFIMQRSRPSFRLTLVSLLQSFRSLSSSSLLLGINQLGPFSALD